MNFQLDKDIWFGNWTSPLELKDTVKTVINVSHHFSTRRGRNVYWANLEQLPWKTFYVRLAAKDHDMVDIHYLNTIESIVMSAVEMDKLPILCHCQMGGHRGPTSAIAVAWILNGKTKKALKEFYDKAIALRPSLANREGLPYHGSMMGMMRTHSLNVTQN
jgi:protein-tyrosine phosphatase